MSPAARGKVSDRGAAARAASLREGHRLFRRLAASIERAWSRAGAEHRATAARALGILAGALRAHEAVERPLIAAALEGGGPADEELARVLRLQHDSLVGLCKDIELLLSQPERYPFERVRPLARLLAGALDEHFRIEERRVLRRLGAARGEPSIEAIAQLKRHMAKVREELG